MAAAQVQSLTHQLLTLAASLTAPVGAPLTQNMLLHDDVTTPNVNPFSAKRKRERRVRYSPPPVTAPAVTRPPHVVKRVSENPRRFTNKKTYK